MAWVPDNRNILKRLDAGEAIIGDGGFVFALEKRGYVCAGPWTPEAVVEHPEAVKQLHREFMRGGSDVMQTFTFYASDDKLNNRGNEAGAKYGCKGINDQACIIAREVADEGENVMVAGGICQTPGYLSGAGKESVQKMFDEQLDCFTRNKVDFMIAEYYEHVEEMEWAIECCLKTGLPVCANMCIGPEGDMHGNSAAVCAQRMAKAGAHIIGINCHYDPFISLECMKLMKEGLKEIGMENKVHLMVQPLAFMTDDLAGPKGKQGFIDLPEFPFALEPRICTRWEMARFTREAYDLGIRFIGGCCGFEPYHIRSCSEELAKERGRRPASGAKWIPGAGGLAMHTKPWVRARASQDYWMKTMKEPAGGRVGCPCCSEPCQWGITQGDDKLKQQCEATSDKQLEEVRAIDAERNALLKA